MVVQSFGLHVYMYEAAIMEEAGPKIIKRGFECRVVDDSSKRSSVTTATKFIRCYKTP